MDFQNNLVGFALLAILHMPGKRCLRVQLPDRDIYPSTTAEHGRFPCQHASHGTAIGSYQRCGEVTVAHIFGQGARYVGLCELADGSR